MVLQVTKYEHSPRPGEVWHRRAGDSWHYVYVCSPSGSISVSAGDPKFHDSIGGCIAGSSGLEIHGDGIFTVYESWDEFVECRRREMLTELERLIQFVNQSCDIALAKGKPLSA